MTSKLNCLDHWFPLIEAAGLPVPKTRIVKAPNVHPVLDSAFPNRWADFIAELCRVAEFVGGFPVFLRTGYSSAKHQWDETCFVSSAASMGDHVRALVEWSESVDMIGLPVDVWAVREMLPTKPVLTLPAYGNMPLCREFRCFVRDANVLCVHPYWPWESVERGFPINTEQPTEFADDWIERVVPPGAKDKWEKLCRLEAFEKDAIHHLARVAGKVVGGEWSVDVLDTDRGFHIIDMALASESWHWPGCPVAKELANE